MGDGRHATDYRPSCYVHNLIMKQNGLTNSHQMRMFLQGNANGLMNLNRQFFTGKNMCSSCTFTHVDPNQNDRYWRAYGRHIGWRRG